MYSDNPYGYLTSQIYANQLGQGQSAAAAAASAQYYWPQTAATTGATSATDRKCSFELICTVLEPNKPYISVCLVSN